MINEYRHRKGKTKTAIARVGKGQHTNSWIVAARSTLNPTGEGDNYLVPVIRLFGDEASLGDRG
jgi:hypothetical protein